MTEPDRPLARPDVVFRSLSNEWVLYDPDTQNLHVLNATAAAVWSCCDGTMTADEIAVEIADALPEAPEVEDVRTDVEDALEEFASEGLLE